MAWSDSIVYIFLISTGTAISSSYSPVVIVPGAPGSQIEAKLEHKKTPAWYCDSTTPSWFTLWLDLSSLLPFKINCWIDNMKLHWDLNNMIVSNQRGVKTRVPGFGGTETIETLDTHGLVKYMKPMVDFLTGLGYTKSQDLRGAPYDYRYSPESIPDGYHQKLKILIEETFELNNRSRVSIISHSYGCVVTQHFLTQQTQEWKRKYLKQWIPIAGIFGGAKQSVHVYTSGYLGGVPGFLVDRLKMRSSQRSGTSNLWMLPSTSTWSKDEVLVKTKRRQYTIDQIDDLFRDIGFPSGMILRHHISNSTHLMSIAPNIPVHCIHGTMHNSTISRIDFQDDFPDNPSELVLGEGDGTVNVESLRLCGQFSKLQKEVVTMKEIEGLEHQASISNHVVLEYIRELLGISQKPPREWVDSNMVP